MIETIKTFNALSEEFVEVSMRHDPVAATLAGIHVWLYFRQGMSTKEIASLPTIGLGAKGVGSVIERLKHGIRGQIVGNRSGSDVDEEYGEKQIPSEARIA